MTKAYLANPYGFSEAGRHFLYDKLIPELEKIGIEILDPWRPLKGRDTDVIAREASELTLKQSIEIGRSNMRMIKDADIVIAVLDGPDVDSGTSGEIGYAIALGKKVYGYRGDFRGLKETTSLSVNLQIAAFIHESGGKIFNSLNETTRDLSKLYGKESIKKEKL